jgi:hypothetical protein
MQDNSDQYEQTEETELENVNTEEVDENPETEGDDVEETESESGPEEVKPKKPGFVEIKDPAVRARVDELTRKMHENERKSLADKRRADELERKLQEYERPAAPKEVPVPNADPITEPEVFARQQRERDNYIKEVTKYEQESEARESAKQQSEAQRKTALVEGYISNMERLKLNPQVLAKAAKTCADYGIDDNHPLIEDILEDKDGPAIVKFLADNPEHLSEVANLKPSKALAYIEREIRAKLNSKPVSKAPPPTKKANGTRTASTGVGGWTIS